LYSTACWIQYEIDKLDMIAIPDFAAGAMENWGLVTYRETALLLDTATDSAANRQVRGAPRVVAAALGSPTVLVLLNVL
jgi:aminopeptidase N